MCAGVMRWLMLGLVWLPLFGQAATMDVAHRIDYCVTATAPDTLNELDRCDWTPHDALSLSDAVKPIQWVRIRFTAPADSQPQAAIQITPHFIPELMLYSATENGQRWLAQSTGSHYPADNPHDVVGGYLFVVDPATSPDVYLKVSGYVGGHLNIAVEPWPTQSPLPQLWLGVHIGILLLMLGFACVSALVEANALMTRLCFYLAVALLSMLVATGFMYKYVYPQSVLLDDVLFALVLGGRLACLVWLSQGFLASYNTPRWYRPVCWLIVAMAATCTLLGLAHIQAGIPVLLVSGILLMALAQIAAIVRTPGIEPLLRRLLLIGYALIGLVIVVMAMSALLPTGIEQLPIYMARLSDLLPALILASLVLFNNRQAKLELHTVKNELLAVNLRNEFNQKLHDERQMMLDMLTHELKNPLASIGFAAGSLAQSAEAQAPDAAQNARRLRNIQQSINNMDAVIERCSLVNALESIKTKTQPALLDVNALLIDLKEALPTTMAQERLYLKVAPGLVIFTDRNLLRIVLSNLIDNALKYALPESMVSVTAYLNNADRVEFVVSNQVEAALMPDEKELFTRFYRHSNAHHVTGTGLGLFLVRALCERLGGSVRFSSVDDRVSFTVELPQ